MERRGMVVYEEGTKRHLPVHLWREILSSLPAKSLVRFRCISKSWLSLINDPDFCRLHLKNKKNNKDETQLLVVQGYQKQNCILRCSHAFETESEEPLDTLGEMFEKGSWYVVCSIDGLVTLTCDDYDTARKLRVWNPSIRKFHDIPPMPEIGQDYFVDHAIGLGYDPLTKDYKYVDLVYSEIDDTPQSVAIYTLGARSWKIIPFHINGCSGWCAYVRFPNPLSVYYRGSLYFTGSYYPEDIRPMELVSFDLSSEVFSSISFPNCIAKSHTITLVDNGDTLAVLDYSLEGGTMWVLNSEGTGWSKRYSFGSRLPRLNFLYQKKNSDILMVVNRMLGDGVEQGRNLVVAYNLETETQKIMLRTMGPDFEVYNVYGYIQSLIMPN